MLSVGVAGVVSTHWPVHDTAAALLAIRFHENVRDGARPVHALIDAQRWLRNSDNATLHLCYPALVPAPSKLDQMSEEPIAWGRQRPFRDSVYWASFSLTGA
jgi:CHAT domain-containing protein